MVQEHCGTMTAGEVDSHRIALWSARRTLAGYEAMAMISKGQVRNIGVNDIRAQAEFVTKLFQVVA
jgi:hypothetical protein